MHYRGLLIVLALVLMTGWAAGQTWDGEGATPSWEEDANWNPDTDVGPSISVTLTPGAADLTTSADVAGLAAGTRMGSVTLDYPTDAAYTHTLNLVSNIYCGSPPALNANEGDGSMVINFNGLDVGWRISGGFVSNVIPPRTTLNLSGGKYQTASGTTTAWHSFSTNSTVNGPGSLYCDDMWVRQGAVLNVGAGTLTVGDGILVAGTISGNGVDSELYGCALRGAHFHDTASVSGLASWHLGKPSGTFTNRVINRYDTGRIDLSGTTLTMYHNSIDTANAETVFEWEALCTVRDIDKGKLGGYAPMIRYNQNLATLRLIDSGSDPDDFAYIGNIPTAVGRNQGIHEQKPIDINDIALLTDMDGTTLQSYVDNGYVINSGSLGAPLVKSIDFPDHGTKHYVAPDGVDITIPPVGTSVMVQ